MIKQIKLTFSHQQFPEKFPPLLITRRLGKTKK